MNDRFLTAAAVQTQPKEQLRSMKTSVAEIGHQASERPRVVYRAFTMFLTLALVAMYALVANGQASYLKKQFDPKHDTNENRIKWDAAAKAYASARDLSRLSQENKTNAQTFFLSYIPAKLTQGRMTPETVKLFNDAKLRLIAARRQGNPGADQIEQWMFTGLQPLALENYAPAPRVAAIMFFAGFEKGRVNGIPLTDSRALGILYQVFTNAEAPDAARAAALKGLDRYVRYTPSSQVAGNAKAALVREMNALIASEPPAGRNKDVHAYLQRFGVNIINNLNPDNTFAKTLVSVSTKKEAHELLALHSVEIYGLYNPANLKDSAADPDAVLKEWSKLAVIQLESELDRFKAKQKKGMAMQSSVKQDLDPGKYLGMKSSKSKDDNGRGGSGRGDMLEGEGMEMEGMEMEGMDGMSDIEDMMGDMGDGMEGFGMSVGSGAQQPPEIIISRQKLNQTFQQIHIGATGSSKLEISRTRIGGLLAAVKDEQKETIKTWHEEFKKIVEAINAETIGTEKDYITAMEETLPDLQKLAGIDPNKDKDGKGSIGPGDDPTGGDDLFGDLDL